MKNLIGILSAVLVSITGIAQEYKPVDQGSLVEFVIKNLGFNTKGSFTGLDGRISFDPANAGKDSFDVSIDAATVNTDNSMRDGHLKKESYFDVEKYPRIRLVSTSVTGPDRSGHYTFNGKLTIRDKTKDISFPFIVTPMAEDYIFKGSFTISRRDFEVGGSSTISNNLTINLTVLAKKQ
ncbi:MAG TPA: YceI family protein [Puia sp.]|nr:YceI family protein [Puia sp.]